MLVAQHMKRMRNAVGRRLGDDASNERVTRTLVRSLYTQQTSRAIGAFNGIVVSMVAAYVVQDLLFTAAAILLSLIAVVRTAIAFFLKIDGNENSTPYLEFIYELGAFAYSGMFGLFAAMSIVMHAGAPVEVLLVAHALCYGAGICARNAGRPFIAMGQMALVFLPVMVGSFIEGSLPLIVLGASIPLAIVALASITSNVFRTLHQSIASADTSRKLAAKMERLALKDVVTGLANRAGLDHALEQAMVVARDEQPVALLWLDLDRFKEVNDLLGHRAGDRVLVEAAKRLVNIVPAGSTISRFAGDEFVIFCKVVGRAHARSLATRILNDLLRPMKIDGERFEIGASIGISIAPEDGTDAETLLQRADLALHRAKREGRGCSRFFDSSMTCDLAERREMEAELRLAIQRDELSIFFQPIIDLKSGRIHSFEALVRWFHPEKGELLPDLFIPVAEKTGVIVTLGNWITAQAAKACATWPDDVSVAVNLSPLQIKAPGAALGIEAALGDANLAPHRLELEVTESLFVEDSEATDRFIEYLAAKGVRFAMDDFGTGYSSLAYINKYPFSKIKVDRSFVSGPDVGKKTGAIIRAVAEMGSQLGMEIVAEGLEEVAQVNAVREAGCTLGQGYYFSRAVPDYLATLLLAQEREDNGIGVRLRASG